MNKNCLIIDAATEALSVALKCGEQVLTHFEVCPQQHSQKLLPTVDRLLKQADISLNQLQYIGFGRGPGSFTGVRIGVGVVQGLAFSSDLPVVGVSTLAAMAQQAISQHGAKKVISAIDARMNEVYFGEFVASQAGLARLDSDSESVIDPNTIHTRSCDEHFAVGTGFETYHNLLAEKFVGINATKITLPSAEFMLPLAEAEFNSGNAVAAEQAQPVYVRDTVTWKKLPGR